MSNINSMTKWLTDSFTKPEIPPSRFIILTFLNILLIAYYGKFRCNYINSHKDILEDNIFMNSDKYGLDGWSITHFISHAFAGYLYPRSFLVVQAVGIMWELFETYVGVCKPDFIKSIGFCKVSDDKYKVWWYGKISDIFVNCLGFMIGVYVYTLMN